MDHGRLNETMILKTVVIVKCRNQEARFSSELKNGRNGVVCKAHTRCIPGVVMTPARFSEKREMIATYSGIFAIIVGSIV